ncbi:hypothetical protein V6N11_052453 [Hibiscus sabdariffa]|uniref:RNase H type-1 domain-containing protein n=1 Tax=Hibiscus sabdariffa TaxID=183260 RepID=A0ABR2UAS0_9ROSI
MERPGSPILVVDQPGCKRGRMDDGLMEDSIDPEDGLGNLMTDGDRRTTMVMEDDGRTKHLMQGVEARDLKALYGPWMQVTNRQRRNGTSQSATNLNKGTGEIKNPMGSRFAALFESLAVMEDGNEEEPLGGFEGDNLAEGKNTSYTNRHQSTKSVALKGKMEVAKSSLNPEKHTAVQMSGEEGIQEPRILKGRILSATFRGSTSKTDPKLQFGVKGGNKVTLKTKKKDGGGTLKTTLAQQLSQLLSDLENSVSGEGERFGDTHTGVAPEISQEDLKGCICWEIGDGKDTDFWYDHWLGEEDRLVLVCNLTSSPRPTLVADMTQENGDWDWNRLNDILPQHILERIEAIEPPRGELGMDRPRWRWDDKFIFSTMSAYKYLIGSPNTDRTFKWKQIWGLKIPQRIRTFMWLVAHERLMTNAERVRRHIANTTRCDICGEYRKDFDHILRSCFLAKSVWRRCVSTATRSNFFTMSFQDWLSKNLFDGTYTTQDDPWSIKFAILCWLIWKRRCDMLFNPSTKEVEGIVAKGNRLLEECRQAFQKNAENRVEQGSEMKWSLPTVGWVKLNVDASVEPNTSRAGIGGVIRDDRGSWRVGFARFIGRCPVLLAEMWAIYEGLLHAWSLGYRKVELESDSLEATHIIKRESESLNKSALVASIRKMLNKDWHIIVHHVNRNHNHVADKLSRRGREGQRLTNLMLEAPEDISSIVMEEKSVHYSMINATGVEERDLPFDPGGCNVRR